MDSIIPSSKVYTVTILVLFMTRYSKLLEWGAQHYDHRTGFHEYPPVGSQIIREIVGQA
jgi:hypothetical protein